MSEHPTAWLALEAQHLKPLTESTQILAGLQSILKTWDHTYGPSFWIEGFLATAYRMRQHADVAERLVTVASRLQQLSLSCQLLTADSVQLRKLLPQKELRVQLRALTKGAEQQMLFAHSLVEDFTEINAKILPAHAHCHDPEQVLRLRPRDYRPLSLDLTAIEAGLFEAWRTGIMNLSFHVQALRTTIHDTARMQQRTSYVNQQERIRRRIERIDTLNSLNADDAELSFTDETRPKTLGDLIEIAKSRAQQREAREQEREVLQQELATDMSRGEKRMGLVDRDVRAIGTAVAKTDIPFLTKEPFGVIRAPVILTGAFLSDIAIRQLHERGVKIRKVVDGGYTLISNAFLFGWSKEQFARVRKMHPEDVSLDPVDVLERLRTYRPGDDSPTVRAKDYERSPEVRKYNLRAVSEPRAHRGTSYQYVLLFPSLRRLGNERERTEDVRITRWDFDLSGRAGSFVEALSNEELATRSRR